MKKHNRKEQDSGDRNEGEEDAISSTCVNTSRLQTQQCQNSTSQIENCESELLDILKENNRMLTFRCCHSYRLLKKLNDGQKYWEKMIIPHIMRRAKNILFNLSVWCSPNLHLFSMPQLLLSIIFSQTDMSSNISVNILANFK
jgi:hypothetical protein